MKVSGTLREIRESSEEELRGRLQRLEEELFGHRMKRYTNQLDNTMKIRQTRREIARVQTILAGRAKGVEQQAAKTESQEKE
jgi:large subunit ribosomal protein L29